MERKLVITVSKSKKIWLGLATLWPTVYISSLFVVVFPLLYFMAQPGMENELPAVANLIGPLLYLTLVWWLVLVFIYVRNAFANSRFTMSKRVLWALLLFWGNIFAMSVYWYLYIWKEPERRPPEGG